MNQEHQDNDRRAYMRQEYTARINRVIDHIESKPDEFGRVVHRFLGRIK